MLLGNKCDMEDKRVVPKAKGEQVGVDKNLLIPVSKSVPRLPAIVGWFKCHVGHAREQTRVCCLVSIRNVSWKLRCEQLP